MAPCRVYGEESSSSHPHSGGRYVPLGRHGEPDATELAQITAYTRCPFEAGWSKYEEWERGRVVSHVRFQRFVLRADRKIQHVMAIALSRCDFLPEESG